MQLTTRKTYNELQQELIKRNLNYQQQRSILSKAKLTPIWSQAPERLESYHTKYDLEPVIKGKSGPLYGIELEVEHKHGSDRPAATLQSCDCDFSEVEYCECGYSDEQDQIANHRYNNRAQTIHKIANETIGKGIIRTESDGSLQYGVEIIFAPLSEKELRVMYSRLYKFLTQLSAAGFISHNSPRCGLHIHISKPAKGTITRIENLLLNTPETIQFWKQFSRRNEFNYCTMQKQAGRNRQARYVALNKLNRETIELRLFRGTLNPKSFFACVEATIALTNFSNNSKRSGWINFVKFCQKNSYPHFTGYVDHKMAGDFKLPPDLRLLKGLDPEELIRRKLLRKVIADRKLAAKAEKDRKAFLKIQNALRAYCYDSLYYYNNARCYSDDQTSYINEQHITIPVFFAASLGSCSPRTNDDRMLSLASLFVVKRLDNILPLLRERTPPDLTGYRIVMRVNYIERRRYFACSYYYARQLEDGSYELFTRYNRASTVPPPSLLPVY